MTDRIQNKNTNKKTSGYFVFFSVKTFNIALICLVILTGFLYLTQVNSSAIKGYVIHDLQTKLASDKLTNKKLELQSQAGQSVSGLTAKLEALGMVSVDKVEYLQAPGGAVAVAR